MKIPGYKILRPIGEGGMATAYLAVQESLHRQVVVKVLRSSEHSRPEDMERFIKEARIVASLNHANVITIYDIGVTADLIFMSMEYVDGGDLRSRMSTVLAPAEALDILSAIANGLSAAHKKGIIHRDVKPGNILFRRDGTPCLTDFGIAKELALDHDLTHTGVFLGSPNYMAPEQATSGTVDGRADLYSLGIIFYEMLTGTKPYQADSVIDIIVKHKQAPLPKLPPDLVRYQPLLELMLAKNRKDRFRDADSLLHYLRQFRSPASETTVSPASEPALDLRQRVINQPAGDKARRLVIPKRRTKRGHAVLAGSVLGVALVYQLFAEIESRFVVTKPPQLSPGAKMRAGLSVVEQVAPPSAPAESTRPYSNDNPNIGEVVKALTWLGQRSLDEYRLTSPPKDNAYYYFSRLREIEPDSRVAGQGFATIAERFAQLAEKELAADHYDQAHRYVTIGLSIDPTNRALTGLQGLTAPRPKAWWQRLLDTFRFS